MKGLLVVSGLLASTYSIAQNRIAGSDLVSQETTQDLNTVEGTIEQQLTYLDELQENKPDINKYAKEELPSIPCISALGMEALQQHLKKFGPLLAAEELQVVRHLTAEEIDCLAKYFSLPQRFNDQQMRQLQQAGIKKSEAVVLFRKSEIQSSTENVKSLKSSIYWRSACRIKHQLSPTIKLGINMEKDPGEPWWTRRGPDYLGYYIHYKSSRRPINIIAGDYTLHFGQGLLFSQNAIGGISGELSMMKRPLANFRPYTSLSEQGALRGAAIGYDKYNFRILLFGSSAFQDGRVFFSEDSSIKYFSADYSGLHRTPTEMLRRNSYRANCWGLGSIYSGSKGHIGIIFSHYSTSITPAPLTSFYQSKTEISRSTGFAGFEYQLNNNRFLIFGETAISSQRGIAMTHSLLLHPDRNIALAINFRVANGRCQSPFALPFGGEDILDGGFGYYTGLHWKLNQQNSLVAFLDKSFQEWLQYRTNTLQRKTNSGLRWIYTPNKSTEGIVQLRQSQELTNIAGSLRTPGINVLSFTQCRLQLTMKPAFGWQMRYRFEIKAPGTADKYKRYSTIAFQDLRYQSPIFPVTLTLRMMLFNVKDFENAIYAQESEPLYSYRSTAFYGRGIGYYILIHGRITKSLDGWIKIGSTELNDREFNDDWSQQRGNIRRDISLQIRYSL